MSSYNPFSAEDVMAHMRGVTAEQKLSQDPQVLCGYCGGYTRVLGGTMPHQSKTCPTADDLVLPQTVDCERCGAIFQLRPGTVGGFINYSITAGPRVLHYRRMVDRT